MKTKKEKVRTFRKKKLTENGFTAEFEAQVMKNQSDSPIVAKTKNKKERDALFSLWDKEVLS